MKYSDFRNFRIVRTCDREYITCESYRKYLQEDFKHRCAYCNMYDDIIGVKSYEIEHFIPRNIFENIKPELEYNYNNLMYACPKCNGKKKDKYKGDINSGIIENELFYNPVEVDYNTIFYRNEYGGISSLDEKGNDMIVTLNLYNPVHNLGWIIDKISEIEEKISEKLNSEKDMDKFKRDKLENADYKLLKYRKDLMKIFNANYYNKKWK